MTLEEFDRDLLLNKGFDPDKYEINANHVIVPRQAAPVAAPTGSSATEAALKAARDRTGAVLGGLGAAALAAPITGGMSLLPALAVGTTAAFFGSKGGQAIQEKLAGVEEGKEFEGNNWMTGTKEAEQLKKEHPVATFVGENLPLLAGGRPRIEQLKNLSTAGRAIAGGALPSALSQAEQHALGNLAVNTALQGYGIGQKVASGQEISPLEEAGNLAFASSLGSWKGKPEVTKRQFPKMERPSETTTVGGAAEAYNAPDAAMVPESAGSVDMQFKLALDPSSPKRTVFVTKGSPGPKEVPGMAVVKTTPEGKLWANPEKFTTPEERKALLDEKAPISGKDLGYFHDAKPEKPSDVVVTTAIDGVKDVITESVPNDPAAIEAAVNHHKAAYPQGETAVSTAADIILHRKAAPAQEAAAAKAAAEAKKSDIAGKKAMEAEQVFEFNKQQEGRKEYTKAFEGLLKEQDRLEGLAGTARSEEAAAPIAAEAAYEKSQVEAGKAEAKRMEGVLKEQRAQEKARVEGINKVADNLNKLQERLDSERNRKQAAINKVADDLNKFQETLETRRAEDENWLKQRVSEANVEGRLDLQRQQREYDAAQKAKTGQITDDEAWLKSKVSEANVEGRLRQLEQANEYAAAQEYRKNKANAELQKLQEQQAALDAQIKAENDRYQKTLQGMAGRQTEVSMSGMPVKSMQQEIPASKELQDLLELNRQLNARKAELIKQLAQQPQDVLTQPENATPKIEVKAGVPAQPEGGTVSGQAEKAGVGDSVQRQTRSIPETAETVAALVDRPTTKETYVGEEVARPKPLREVPSVPRGELGLNEPARSPIEAKAAAEREGEYRYSGAKGKVEGEYPETMVEGKPGLRETLLKHYANLGGKAQEFEGPYYTTEGDITERRGKWGKDTGIEVNQKFASDTSHEVVHDLLEKNPDIAKRLTAKAQELGFADLQEYLADRGALSLMNRVASQDKLGLKDVWNTLRFHFGSKDADVLFRVLENRFLYGIHKPGGEVTQGVSGGKGILDALTKPAGEPTTRYSGAKFSVLEDLEKKNPTAATAAEKMFNDRTTLRGALGGDVINKLQKFDIQDVANVIKKHLDIYRNGTTHTMSGDEAAISKILQDHWTNVEQLQHAADYPRKVKGSKFYFPEQISSDVQAIVEKGIHDPQVREVIDTIAQHWASKGKDPVDAAKEAENFVIGLSGARFGRVGMGTTEGFNPLRTAAGLGLPEVSPSGVPIRETDPLRALQRYGDQAATDMSFQKNVATQIPAKELESLRTQKDGPWQQIENLYWNQDKVNYPTLRAANKLVTSSVLGPISKTVEVATNPQNAMAFGAGFGDVGRAIKRVTGDFTRQYDKAVKGGIVTPRSAGDENFGQIYGGGTPVKIMNKVSDFIGKYTGTRFLEETSRVLSYSLGEATAETRMANNDAKWFKERGVDINDPQAVEKAASQMAEMIQGRRDARELPAAMLKGPLAEIAPIHRWAVGHSANLAKEIQQGNYSNFVGYMAAGLGVALGRDYLNQFIKGNEGATPTMKELAAAKYPTAKTAAAVTDMLRSAGIGGALVDMANYGLKKAGNQNAQLIYNPLASAVQTSLLDAIPQFSEAVSQGVAPEEAAGILAKNMLRSLSQVGAVVTDLSKSEQEREQDRRARNLRTYENLMNDRPAFSGTVNPILTEENREFSRTQDPEEAMRMLDILERRGKSVSTPRNYMAPADPLDRMRFMRFLEASGQEDPNLMEESYKQDAINAMKRGMIMGRGLGRKNMRMKRLMEEMAGE